MSTLSSQDVSKTAAKLISAHSKRWVVAILKLSRTWRVFDQCFGWNHSRNQEILRVSLRYHHGGIVLLQINVSFCLHFWVIWLDSQSKHTFCDDLCLMKRQTKIRTRNRILCNTRSQNSLKYHGKKYHRFPSHGWFVWKITINKELILSGCSVNNQ